MRRCATWSISKDIDQNTRLAWVPTRCERVPLPKSGRLLEIPVADIRVGAGPAGLAVRPK